MDADARTLGWWLLNVNSWLSIGLRSLAVLVAYLAVWRVGRCLARGRTNKRPSGHWLPSIVASAVFFFLLPMALWAQCQEFGSHYILMPRAHARRFLKNHGRYPSSLAELCKQNGVRTDLPALCGTGKDRWGNAIHYESKGDRYIVVSFGRDGKPDGIDYWKLRDNNSYRNVCGEPDADHVVSDRGSHQGCGK